MGHGEKDPSGASSVYGRDKRAVVGTVAGLLATGALGVAVWAHAKLLDHDARLVHVETQQTADTRLQQAVQGALDLRLQRIEDKQDRMLERLQRPRSTTGSGDN